MELERKKTPHKPQGLLQPKGQLFPANPYCNTEIPLQTLKTTLTAMCVANQSNQEQFNSNDTIFQPFTSTAIDKLTPSYLPSKQYIDQQEKKALLRTLNPVIPNEKMIKELYKKAKDISKEFTLDKFSKIVTLMNNAKSNINEDILAKHAYELWLPWRHNTHPEDTRKRLRPIFFFGFLKSYNLKITTTEECVPKPEDLLKKESVKKVGNPLAEEFNLASSVNITVESYTHDASTTSANYPAFHAVKTYADSKAYDSMKDFILYIYSQKETPENKYLKASYDAFRFEFYSKAGSFMNYEAGNDHQILYELLEIIEAGKNLNPKKQEYNLGYDILTFPQTPIDSFLTKINMDTTEAIRKKIAFLCHAIKEYNDVRQTKKTPTVAQFKAYQDYLRFDLQSGHSKSDFSFPNNFDTKLFDQKEYDFDGFDKLVRRMKLIRSSTDENVEETIDQINFTKS